MNIPQLFEASWNQVYRGAITYGDSDVLPEQRIIITNRNVGKLVWGQLVMMFDEQDRMALISTRYCIPQLAVPGYLHTLAYARKLRKLGIIVNVAFESEVVTCTYSRIGWLAHVVQQSSAQSS